MRTILLLAISFVSSLIFAQQASAPAGFVPIPGGELEVKSRIVNIKPFYIQAQEVSNEDYNKFLVWTEKNKSKEEALRLKPSLPKKEMKLLPKGYFKSSKYLKYPVVGITREMGELYCEYLTQINPEVKGMFRLPFEREWIYAAKGGHTSNTFSSGNSLESQEGKTLCNYKLNGKESSPMLTNSFEPNAYGVYNMSGNVAEWVREEGKSKGGSWNDKAEDLLIESKDPRFGHPEASPFTGFRVVWAGSKF